MNICFSFSGKDRDIENFVLLVKELRQFFDAQRNGVSSKS